MFIGIVEMLDKFLAIFLEKLVTNDCRIYSDVNINVCKTNI